nr:hypothetical protein [uncultured Oribacterium sp.]
MACVAVPIVEGILVKTAEWILVQKERKEEARIKAIKGEVNGKILTNGEKSYSFELKNENFPEGEKNLSLKHSGREVGLSLRKKLHLLSNFLFSGSILLVFEHFWHGEIVPFFPFLTGARSPEDTYTMLQEMSTVGVSMALLITVIWAIYCFVLERKLQKEGERNASIA